MGCTPEPDRRATTRRMAALHPDMVGQLRVGQLAAGSGKAHRVCRRVDAHVKVLLVVLASPASQTVRVQAIGRARPSLGQGPLREGRVGYGGGFRSCNKLCRTPRCNAMNLSYRGYRHRYTSGWCLYSTAGAGKPHVRWCGRITGRNPRDPIRSPIAAN